MSERHRLPPFQYDTLDTMTAIKTYRRAYATMVEPSLSGEIPHDSENSYADGAGMYGTTYAGVDLLEVCPDACATLGIVESDDVTFMIHMGQSEEAYYIPAFFVLRYPKGNIEDMRMAWVINGSGGDFRTRITGDAIEDDGFCDVPLMQEELDAIDEITRAMFPEAPEFA